MKKTFSLVGLVFIFLLQGSLVLAIDCNSVSPANQETCLEILSYNLTEYEKELLISNLEYGSKFYPDHSYVYDYNTNLQITSPPNGTLTSNGQYIRNSWVKTLTAMPSVFYNNSIYCPSNVKVLSAYNHDVVLPSNYYSPGYPSTNQGDCRRTYRLVYNYFANNVYVNERYQGEGSLVSSNINSDSIIKSEYGVDVAVEIKHYEWDRYCDERDEHGDCIDWDYDCDFDYTEIDQETLIVEDQIEVRYYNSTPLANLTLENPLTNSLGLNKTNSVEIGFENSFYGSYEYVYEINYSYAPYYIRTLVAKDYNQEKLENLYKQGDHLIVNNLDNCQLKAFDFFTENISNCDLDSEYSSFYIKTDKLTYSENESIFVDVFPNNLTVSLSYGNQTKVVQGGGIFVADKSYNRISATYKNSISEEIIYVKDESKILVLWDLSLFGFLNYFLYAVIRKYWGGFL